MKKCQIVLLVSGLALLIYFFVFYNSPSGTEDAKTSRTEPSGEAVQAPSWDSLKTMVQEKTGEPVCDIFYLHDGSDTGYAFVFTGKKQEDKGGISFQGALWYAEGQECILAQDEIQTDLFEPVLIEHEKEQHLLFQTPSKQPGDVTSFIWAAKGHQPVLTLETPNACFLDNGNLAIVKTFYSNSAGGRIWQRYYLYWDAEREAYQEYKGRALTEEQFLTYENALETRDKVETAIKKDHMNYHNSQEADKIEYDYLIRDNGILNINFKIICGDDVYYCYAILAEKNGQVNLEKWKDYDMYERGYIFESGGFGSQEDSASVMKDGVGL